MVKNIIFYIFIALTLVVVYFYFMGKSSSEYSDVINRQHEKQQKYLKGIDSLKIAKRLNYFTVNKEYITTARVQMVDSSTLQVGFQGDKETVQYIRIALLSFKLRDSTYQLTLFKDLESKHFVLPFTDSTNTYKTHATGRYLPIDFRQQDFVDLDFNMAYNPYCAYDTKYTCTISPEENFLPVNIKAGELRY